MIYLDDNIHNTLEKVAEAGGLKTAKGYGSTVRRHNRYVRSGGKRGNLMEVSPSTWTQKTSSVYADDNIHEALEKAASLWKRTAPKLSEEGMLALRKAIARGDTKAVAMGKQFGIGGAPKKVSRYSYEGAKLGPNASIPAGGLHFKAAADTTRRRRDNFNLLAAGAGGLGGVSAVEAIMKRKMKLPGAAAVAIPSALLASEAYKSFRSGARKRELRRRGSEMQTYAKELRKTRRIAGKSVKTANAQMVKMYMRQGLDPEAAVKKAYPHWSAQRRREVVRQIMER